MERTVQQPTCTKKLFHVVVLLFCLDIFMQNTYRLTRGGTFLRYSFPTFVVFVVISTIFSLEIFFLVIEMEKIIARHTINIKLI